MPLIEPAKMMPPPFHTARLLACDRNNNNTKKYKNTLRDLQFHKRRGKGRKKKSAKQSRYLQLLEVALRAHVYVVSKRCCMFVCLYALPTLTCSAWCLAQTAVRSRRTRTTRLGCRLPILSACLRGVVNCLHLVHLG